MAGHTADVMCVDTCEDGEFIVSGDENEVAKIWTAVGQCLHTLKGHGGWINCCSIFERTVVTGSEDETLKVVCTFFKEVKYCCKYIVFSGIATVEIACTL
jgi:WD40 repeat protein